jgi:hypothetical protein
MDILFLLLFSFSLATGADTDEGNGIDPHGG